jgi:hypothetical protein
MLRRIVRRRAGGMDKPDNPRTTYERFNVLGDAHELTFTCGIDKGMYSCRVV